MGVSQRIAVYGGTFDPVHHGHVEVARRILELFALDEVIFMPAYVAPHRRRERVASAFHRYAMLVLATQDDERLRISTAELDAPDRPYTVETIGRLRQEFGESKRLFFVMGADSWLEIETWRDWNRLLALCDHIVVTRPGYELNVPGISAPEKIVDVRQFDERRLASVLSDDAGPRVFLTDAVMVNVSATGIRAAATAGDREQLGRMAPAPVADYIQKYGLYQKANEPELERKNVAS
jgi:nicotinate-nucleotide adenylyltransferase